MKRSTKQWAALALSLVLVGCVSKTIPLVLPQESSNPNLQQAPVKTPVYGTLRITVRWPQKYYTNTIPQSTDAFVLQVMKDGQEATSSTLIKDQGTTALLKVIPGNNYALKVNAYRNYSTQDQTLVASAYNPTINIQPAKTTQVPIDLVPLYVPYISSLNTNVLKAGHGGGLQIIGGNFGTGSVLVEFNGATQSVIPDASTSLTVNLTTGNSIRSGNVYITADGVKTENPAYLWVFNNLTASAATDSLAVNQSLQLTASPSWLFDGPLPEENLRPLPSWESLPSSIASISPTGLLTGVAAGSVTVRAMFGTDYSNEIAFTVIPAFEVLSVGIQTPPVWTIYVPPSDGATSDAFLNDPYTVDLTANVAVSVGASSGVDWTASNALVELQPIGDHSVRVKAKAQPNGEVSGVYATGVVIITATSRDDANKSATTSIGIDVSGGLNVTLH